MATNKKQKKMKLIDPYTGEVTPLAEDAGKVEEIVPVDTGDRSGENYLLNEETSMDHAAADEDADAVAQESTSYTEDADVETSFKNRQELGVGGRSELDERLDEYHSKSPKLSGGDLDAQWELADSAGEETVGGSTPTPDQDVIDELGQAVGLSYNDDEPLGGEEKLRKRDRNRLVPNSKPKDKDASSND